MAQSVGQDAKFPNIWSSIFKRPLLLISILFLGCVCLFIASIPVPRADGLLIGSDGTGYFANLRSLFMDHDLDLRNDYRLLTGTVPAGAETAKYTIGLPLAWLPFYLVAHLLVLLLNALGYPIQADGYNIVYQAAVCMGTMAYGYLGLVLVYNLCREFFDSIIALSATVTIWFGWNVVYYLVIENSMSHIVSMTVISALITWWRAGSKCKSYSLSQSSPLTRQEIGYWSIGGILAGFAAMVRPQDIAFAILPLFSLAHAFLKTNTLCINDGVAKPARRGIYYAGVIFAIAVLLGYLPQLITSAIEYGNPLGSGYMARGEHFDWFSPHLFDVLFSLQHGLITWHPLILIALLGLLLLAHQDKAYALVLGVAWLLQVYIVASWDIWWQGDSFGARMFINCTPLFALSLSALFAAVHNWAGYWPVVIISALAITWNFLFIIQYRFGFISMSDAITFEQLTSDKITLIEILFMHMRQLLSR